MTLDLRGNITPLEEVLADASERLLDLDEQLVEEDDENDIPHEQALRELFTGNITANDYGSRYGWAFETPCNYLGTDLSNQSFSPCPIEWYGQLDECFASADLDLRFDILVNNCSIEMPEPDDWPMIGHTSK